MPFGFQAKALPIYLRQNGVDLASIGFLGLLALPWMLKALWAPLVDRFHLPAWGKRRSWILPCQLLLTLTCGFGASAAALEDLSPGNGLPWILASVFLMNLFAATMDIAVDGLAVDILERDELGLGNSAQVVGYKIGMLTSGGLLVWASGLLGWQGLFLAMGCFQSLVFLFTLFTPEPPARAPVRGEEQEEGQGEETPSLKQILQTLWRALKVPGGVWLLVFVATYKLGESLIDPMVSPFLVDCGFSAEQLGKWVGTYGMVASILGSLAGGLLAFRLPGWPALALATSARAVPLLLTWMLTLSPPSDSMVLLVTCSESFFGGALTTVMFAFMMARVDRRVGATHYTLLATVEVMGKGPPSVLSGVMAQHLGYGPVFGIGAGISLLFLVFLLPLRSSEPSLPVSPDVESSP